MAQRIVDQTITPEDLEKLEKEKLKAEKKAKQAVSKGSDSEKSASKSNKSKTKKKRGTKYKSAIKKINKEKDYSIEEAVKTLKEVSFADFNETVELHVNLGIDTKNSDQRIRFTTTLPHGTGKSTKVLILSENNSGLKGDILYRDASAVAEIVSGKLVPNKDFDVVVASTKMMKNLAKAARILGPKGMMPSPKTGTVTDNPENVIKDLAKGQIEIKNQAGHAVLHQIVGKLDFDDKALVENIKHLVDELNANTPAKMKKKLVQKVYLATSMSPSVKVEI